MYLFYIYTFEIMTRDLSAFFFRDLHQNHILLYKTERANNNFSLQTHIKKHCKFIALGAQRKRRIDIDKTEN